ncbi:hypothetical protein FBU30_004794 [Linnemannia zychae]|nr:hypothetical protein FBU30_004794 [Linnemannia zychae]
MILYPSDSTVLIKPGSAVRTPPVFRLTLANLANGSRLVAAGPPKIIKKNPNMINALLERPVPSIAIQKRNNMLLGDFHGHNIDIARNGKVIDMSMPQTRHSFDQATRKSRKEPGIVVGIDLGNTYTGVSYAHQSDGELIDVVKWPKSIGTYSKVPTVNLYNSEVDTRELIDWGSSAMSSYKRSKRDRTLVSDYKLQFFDEGRRAVLKHGLFPTDVLVHFLKGLHEYLIDEINKAQVAKAEAIPMHYCVTIPKSWGRPTQGLIVNCYVEAGIIPRIQAPNIAIITEAEAAAVYCREHCVETDILKDGELFMICDAGGWTTQITVFRVDDSLGVRQFVYLTSSHTEDCGSAILDQNFRYLVLRRLSGLDLDARSQRQKALETLLDGFTEIKTLFDVKAKEEIKHLSVPMGLDIHELKPTPDWMEDGFMAISGQELCDNVFDPVIEQIVNLILEQAHQHAKTFAGLFLVGGLGSNKYFYHRLKETFLSQQSPPSPHPSVSTPLPSQSSPPNIPRINLATINEELAPISSHAGLFQFVAMMPKAELAITRGAVIYGLKNAAAKALRSSKQGK